MPAQRRRASDPLKRECKAALLPNWHDLKFLAQFGCQRRLRLGVLLLNVVGRVVQDLACPPVWGTLIALAVAGEPVIGVVSAPALGRLWWSSPQDGAFTKDVDGSIRAIKVSGVKSLADASFSFSDFVSWEVFKSDALQKLTSAVWRTRGYGDFWSHLLVAEGAVDIAIEPELQTYDMAAFIAIVQGAGGKVTGAKGQSPMEAGQAISTNSILHSEVLNFLN